MSVDHRIRNAQMAYATEAERRAILNKPVRQDPALFAPTRVKALRPFCVDGKRIEVGQHVEVPRHLADDLVAVGRAQL